MGIGGKALFSEPKVLITGVEGAGKTLFAVQQADLLAQQEGTQVYQVNIRGADPGHLPKLPFDLREMSTTTDPETGDLLPRWAVDLEPGTVVIVDEAHKIYPQRGPGRPPKDLEMLGEGRQKGIRFVYLSQSPDSIDGFLRERIHRHFHLERRGNMERATIFEFDHYVYKPRTAWQERKDATVHLWAYPKEYFGWYTSAKTHTFKRRIPWKIFAAVAFLPIAGFVAWSVISKVGGLSDGVMPSAKSQDGTPVARRAPDGEKGAIRATSDPAEYLAQFAPVVQEMPWSAPAYQGNEVGALPDLFCMSGGAGVDAQGERKAAGCGCITEQGTRYLVPPEVCEHIARHGQYNPYRSRGSSTASGDARRPEDARPKPGEARTGPSGVAALPAPPAAASVDQVAAYGGFRDVATAALETSGSMFGN